MSKKVQLPDYIVVKVKKFFSKYEATEDPAVATDNILEFVKIHEGITVDTSMRAFLIDSASTSLKNEPLPVNTTEKFHRMVKAVVTLLHKKEVW